MKTKIKQIIFTVLIALLTLVERLSKALGVMHCYLPTLLPFLENDYSYDRKSFILVQWRKKLLPNGSVCLPNLNTLGKRYVRRVLALNPALRVRDGEVIFISRSHDMTTTVPVAIAVRRGSARSIDLKILGQRLEKVRGEGNSKGVESYRLCIPANRGERRSLVKDPKGKSLSTSAQAGNACTDALGVICGAAVVDTAMVIGLTGAVGPEGVSLVMQIIIGALSMCMMLCWTYVKKRAMRSKPKRRK